MFIHNRQEPLPRIPGQLPSYPAPTGSVPHCNNFPTRKTSTPR